jgi:FlaA1/EpsC-like NDP-sugar epimerase
VQVEDLLRRTPVELELSGSGDYVSDRVVLVTGAGGSIGAEIVRQVARLGPSKIVLFGQGENSLHALDGELAREMPTLERAVVVGTVRDRTKLDETMAAFRPHVVFHAAAHKHVPLMEHHPDEAVLNNVAGTRNVAEAALDAGVRRYVNISTDKAVKPVSMVGVTKAIAERVVRSVGERAQGDAAFVSVRFGNVLGSRGSVVPLFQEQIRRGGPITITHPDMTRYFMTIPEASRLVIQAGALARNGAVYVLDMGTPVRIVDLARDMVRLSGLEPDDIEMTFTGLRPGEKLAEELFTADERLASTRFEQIMAGQNEPPNGAFDEQIERLLRAAASRDWEALRASLASLSPGFRLVNASDLQLAREAHD